MTNKEAGFEHITDPFEIHLSTGVVAPDVVEKLFEQAPLLGAQQIARTDPAHEKQYRMNLLYLVRDGVLAEGTLGLSGLWSSLVADLMSDEFTRWLEEGTGLKLAGLPFDMGVYTHVDGDFISVHKDKPNKQLTAILYLNPEWPAGVGGEYEVRLSGDPAQEPARRIPPAPGQLLAFPPTDTSWHAVSKVDTGGTLTRLTVQLEYWFEDWATRHGD
ncbi:2OG-Fe(II) oxygenase [Lentzea sp. NPDC004782]|uniref:2OG-Fe(II) oxygenase n=1 Tax=Lentzea sp. NPDC004782 TaxID=3154458 RepID=UPI0033A813AE